MVMKTECFTSMLKQNWKSLLSVVLFSQMYQSDISKSSKATSKNWNNFIYSSCFSHRLLLSLLESEFTQLLGFGRH